MHLNSKKYNYIIAMLSTSSGYLLWFGMLGYVQHHLMQVSSSKLPLYANHIACPSFCPICAQC